MKLDTEWRDCSCLEAVEGRDDRRFERAEDCCVAEAGGDDSGGAEDCGGFTGTAR